MGAGWLKADGGFGKVHGGEFLADVAPGKAPRFQGESKGLLRLEEELGLQPA